jgi:hypothetical protein
LIAAKIEAKKMFPLYCAYTFYISLIRKERANKAFVVSFFENGKLNKLTDYSSARFSF